LLIWYRFAASEETKEPRAKEAKVLLSNDVGKVVFPGTSRWCIAIISSRWARARTWCAGVFTPISCCTGDAISIPPLTKVRIGAGLTQDNDAVVSTKCGILKQPERGKLVLDTAQKRVRAGPRRLILLLC
jgi:hypothetical protein